MLLSTSLVYTGMFVSMYMCIYVTVLCCVNTQPVPFCAVLHSRSCRANGAWGLCCVQQWVWWSVLGRLHSWHMTVPSYHLSANMLCGAEWRAGGQEDISPGAIMHGDMEALREELKKQAFSTGRMACCDEATI